MIRFGSLIAIAATTFVSGCKPSVPQGGVIITARVSLRSDGNLETQISQSGYSSYSQGSKQLMRFGNSVGPSEPTGPGTRGTTFRLFQGDSGATFGQINSIDADSSKLTFTFPSMPSDVRIWLETAATDQLVIKDSSGKALNSPARIPEGEIIYTVERRATK